MRPTRARLRLGVRLSKSCAGSSKQLVVQDVDTAWKALRLFETGTADFADYLIERSANAAGCKLTVTFDKKASSTGYGAY